MRLQGSTVGASLETPRGQIRSTSSRYPSADSGNSYIRLTRISKRRSGHDATRWHEFKRRYAVELGARQDLVAEILSLARDRPVTLLYSARDPDHNQAVALAEYLAAKAVET